MYLRPKAEAEIDALVKKIIRDIGNPEPPLRMEDVLDRLQLDRGYYSTTDDGFLRDSVHKLKVAGQQVLKRPTLLLDAIKKMSLKALFIPDRKRILIDKTLPSAKIRWAEGHEVVHCVIPWHDTLMHGDTKQTLTPGCAIQIEAEANYGAGRLLFLRDTFRSHLNSGATGMEDIKALATRFGNSITSTMWRAIESVDYPA
jgi:Zn-dependent peptidase ImmA (M78 family)